MIAIGASFGVEAFPDRRSYGLYAVTVQPSSARWYRATLLGIGLADGISRITSRHPLAMYGFFLHSLHAVCSSSGNPSAVIVESVSL